MVNGINQVNGLRFSKFNSFIATVAESTTVKDLWQD